jgi:menaquinol-cytochrome c reductase iron-sulfur subunit
VESQHYAQQLSPSDGTRRSFLGAILGIGSACIGALLAIPVLRYVFYPLADKSTDEWNELGPIADFSNLKAPVLRTFDFVQRDGWRKIVSKQVVFVTQGSGQPKALSAICPHLGCSVSWNNAEAKFVCPCHGGVFAPDGTCRSGPPPRSLDSLETKVSAGKLMVKYQYFRPNVPNREVTS